MSAVRGVAENTEAVARELNATITVPQSEGKQLRGKLHTGDTGPEGGIHRGGDADLFKHLELEIIADVQNTTNEHVFSCI